jgi:hypothetical protein
MGELLTEENKQELTDYKMASKQAASLRDHDIPFVTRPDGRIRTTWYNVNHPLSRRINEDEIPNFGALE